MANTRYSNDECRQTNRMYQSTGALRYMLDTPGPGADVGYMTDPTIRLQKWGANLWTNSIDIHTELTGRTQPLNRDCIYRGDMDVRVHSESNWVDDMRQSYTYSNGVQRVQQAVPNAAPIAYHETDELATGEPRVLMPAWQLRDMPSSYTTYLLDDPQQYTDNPFRFGENVKRNVKDAQIQQEKTLYKS